MSVESTKVRGRRKLRFSNFDEIQADAQRANSDEYVSIGNWSLGQTLKHLGLAMLGSIDAPPFRVPLGTRLLGRWVFRYYILYWAFPPGAKLPKSAERVLVPKNDTEFENGLKTFQLGVERLEHEKQRSPHPVIGKLSIAQWNKFHLRHAELHLSFFVPPAKS